MMMGGGGMSEYGSTTAHLCEEEDYWRYQTTAEVVAVDDEVVGVSASSRVVELPASQL